MDEITYDKPFKTYDELIALLKSRNIIIPDEDFAKAILCDHSYYMLINGYKNSFLSLPDTDSFAPGTTFNDLYTLHLLDMSLNSILLKHIIYIEHSLKSKISYLVSQEYGVYTDKSGSDYQNKFDYLHKSHYSTSNNRRNSILHNLRESIRNVKNNPIMIHYLNDINHLPPWILVTNIPFGLSIEWYGILKNDDKSKICTQFIKSNTLTSEEQKEFLRKSLILLKEYRNKIAHGNRTFSIQNLPVIPKKQLLELTYGMLSEKEYNSRIGQNDLLAVLFLFPILSNDMYMLKNLVTDLEVLFMPYITKDIRIGGKTIFDIFSLPVNFFERIKKIIISKFL